MTMIIKGLVAGAGIENLSRKDAKEFNAKPQRKKLCGFAPYVFFA